MDLPEHLEALREALSAFVHHAAEAGLDAPVPTAPAWTVRQLVAHQGMVHRWAAATLRGERSDPTMAEGLAADDPVGWLHEGGLAVLDTLEQVPDDVHALVFLEDAPPPRQFWARRQCHETTIHAVDALAAARGRMPLANDTWISRAVALDGIDELLTGFIPRKRSPLRSDEPMTFGVLPTDAEESWLVRVSQDPPVTARGEGAGADVVLEGPAVALYLAVWNRSDEVVPDGFELWQQLARVTWS